MRVRGAAVARGWTHRYPPLVMVIVALMLTVFLLPSALNLPQANPGQTTEYAPVPGNNGQAPPGGNLAGLGLGSGNAGAGGVLQPPPPPLTNTGTNPSTKDCVGNPPRQTEDPASPPCVGYYAGNNGGATYQGVTGTEVRVLFYFDGNQKFCCSSQGTEQTPTNQYFDLAVASQCQSGGTWVAELCNWEKYFNYRYQTYNRFVHFFVYFNNDASVGEQFTPAERQQDAADNYAHVHPFAVFDYGLPYNWDVYQTAMVQHGVISFGGAYPPAPGGLNTESAYQTYPKLIWGFAPAVEELARMYSTFICKKVVPYPVSFSGIPGANRNQKRVYGLLHTSDTTVPELQLLWQQVKQQVQACGVTFALEKSFPVSGFAQNGTPPNIAAQNMADFQQQGVTTIIWPGGYETQHSNAAAKLNYYPEWITAGDYIGDGNVAAAFQDQSEWAHNWVVTPELELNTNGEVADPDCYTAYGQAAGQFSSLDIPYACSFYENLRMLFTGVQVAGPNLNPTTVDEGFHAIPPAPGKTPQSPSCFYNANDYTCLKNAVAEYWSTTGGPDNRAGSTAGCYRMADNAARFLAGRWPSGDVTAMATASDPCNDFSGTAGVTNRGS